MVTSVLSGVIGRKCLICVENWSIRYTLGYRHRLRDPLTMNSPLASPSVAFSSSSLSHRGRSCGLAAQVHRHRWPCGNDQEPPPDLPQLPASRTLVSVLDSPVLRRDVVAA